MQLLLPCFVVCLSQAHCIRKRKSCGSVFITICAGCRTGMGIKMKNIRKLITLILAVVSVLAVATTALAAYSTMYVNCPLGETVRLRKTASSSGVILANISRGTAVQAEPYNSNWHKVKYNNQTGYMMSSFLSRLCLHESSSIMALSQQRGCHHGEITASA